MGRGRKKGPRVVVRCAAGEKCLQPDADGGGGWIEKLPSEMTRAATGRVFHDAACRNVGHARVGKMATAVCQYDLCPGPREFTYPAKYGDRKFHHQCYLDHRRNQVERKCKWCGASIVAAESKKRSYCTTEAPEPDSGWPEGVRMTCAQLGQYVNLDLPLRFVNGKPVRVWINRNRDDDRRNMVWDPSAKDGGGWVFEHRWNWEQRHGMKLPDDIHVHHVNGDKSDNDPDHLEGLTPSAHARLHGAQSRAVKAERDAAVAEVDRLKAELEALRSNMDRSQTDAPDPYDEWDEEVAPTIVAPGRDRG